MKKATIFSNIIVVLLLLITNFQFQSNCLYAGNSIQIINDSSKAKADQLVINNMGDDFWFSVPTYVKTSGTDDSVKIYITSPFKTTVHVEIPGKGYSQSQSINPNGMIVFDLSDTVGLPYVKADSDTPPVEQIYTESGIHVYSDDPIIVYCVAGNVDNSEGFLALPVHALGTNYIASSYSEDPMFSASGYHFPSEITITAPFDNTIVKFTLGGNVNTRTVGGLIPGNSINIILNKGDVWSVNSKSPNSDFSGSKIETNKPVSVLSANQYSNVPVGNQLGNYTVEQNIPTYLWDKYCFTPSIQGRTYSAFVRVFSSVTNTTIYRNGSQIGTLSTNGGMINKGWFEMRIVPADWGNQPAILSGDKPITVVENNTGGEEDMSVIDATTPHSPFAMNIVPTNQFKNDYLFTLPGIDGTNQFTYNYLNLIYIPDSLNKPPDDLMFGTVVADTIQWEAVKTKFPTTKDYSFGTLVGGVRYNLHRITVPSKYGVYRIKANAPFGLYIYGSGSTGYPSYGYPIGCRTKDYTHTDSLAPVVTIFNPDTSSTYKNNYIIYGKVDDDPSLTGTQSNLGQVFLLPEEYYNYKLNVDEFLPGISAFAGWRLKVIDNTQKAYAKVVFADRAGNDTIIEVNYQPNGYTILDSIPPQVTWTIDSCSGVITGKAIEMPYDSTICSNFANVSVTNGSFNFQLQYSNLIFGVTDSLAWTLTPVDPSNDATSVLSFVDVDGNITNITINYLGTRYRIVTNNEGAFVNFDPGDSLSNNYYLINDSKKSVVINDIMLKYGNQCLSIIKPTLPVTLYSNDSIKFTINFTPNKIGDFYDSIGIVDNCSQYFLKKIGASFSYNVGVPADDINFTKYLNIIQHSITNQLDISFELVKTGNINLCVYDIFGREVGNLINNELLSIGKHQVVLDYSKFITGTYFIRLSGENQSITRKFNVIK